MNNSETDKNNEEHKQKKVTVQRVIYSGKEKAAQASKTTLLFPVAAGRVESGPDI